MASKKQIARLKARYKQREKELAEIEKERAKILEPTKKRYDRAVDNLTRVEDALFDASGAIVYRCEGCLALICEGEQYHPAGEDFQFCEPCAPVVGPTLDELLKDGEKAYEWFLDGKEGYDAYVSLLKSMPRDAKVTYTA